MNENSHETTRQLTEVFNDSFDRCTRGNHRFFKDFYDAFLAASPRVREKFSGTDMATQALMLKESLAYVMLAATSTATGVDRLSELATIHDRHHKDVEPELYDVWLESLIQVVRAHDPEFDPTVENAWRTTLAKGVAFMKSRY